MSFKNKLIDSLTNINLFLNSVVRVNAIRRFFSSFLLLLR